MCTVCSGVAPSISGWCHACDLAVVHVCLTWPVWLFLRLCVFCIVCFVLFWLTPVFISSEHTVHYTCLPPRLNQNERLKESVVTKACMYLTHTHKHTHAHTYTHWVRVTYCFGYRLQLVLAGFKATAVSFSLFSWLGVEHPGCSLRSLSFLFGLQTNRSFTSTFNNFNLVMEDGVINHLQQHFPHIQIILTWGAFSWSVMFIPLSLLWLHRSPFNPSTPQAQLNALAAHRKVSYRANKY